MTHPEPSITVKVDVTNPGQFFACCGLLELADRLWPTAEITGGFTPDKFQRSQFLIFSERHLDVGSIVRLLCGSKRTPVDPHRAIKKNGALVNDYKKIRPICLEISRDDDQHNEPISMRLSWWLDELAGHQLDDFKLWAAHQSSESLINGMAREIEPHEINEGKLLDYSRGMTGRTGLDPRSSWNALDEGFSPKNQNIPVETFPATELLAAIGLQTFVPTPEDNGYAYVCWITQLPTVVARAVASNRVSLPNASRYQFRIGRRGRFKYLTKASRIEKEHP